MKTQGLIKNFGLSLALLTLLVLPIGSLALFRPAIGGGDVLSVQDSVEEVVEEDEVELNLPNYYIFRKTR